jgi:23S rRNA (cytosine1962-C5)-methyltransferase
MSGVVTINKRGVARVRARNCWVYRSDIVDAKHAGPGELVRVAGPSKQIVGSAIYSSQSQIALRFVSFDDLRVDRDFWHSRLAAANRLRQQIAANKMAYRLVYGESDLLPSLIVDRYGDCFVIQTLSQGMDALKQMWVELLVQSYSPRSIVERNEARVRVLEGLPRVSGVVYGEEPGELSIEEAGIRFSVDILHGQKTGTFLDQSENRIAAERYARGRSLDCFTFEGGFALHLAKGAREVVAIDISEAATTRAKRNAEINDIHNVDFIEANVFDRLREMERAGERFDVIVLDPPAFAKSRSAVQAALRGYKEINLRAMKMLTAQGTLVTSTCSYHMSEDQFLNVLSEAAADAGRTARIIEKRGQSRDHPVLLSMPETYYLKCVILSVE